MFLGTQIVVILFYEALRAKVVATLTIGAASAIAPSSFSFPVFGPIICGTIAGCGGECTFSLYCVGTAEVNHCAANHILTPKINHAPGAFLPLNKGLDPIANGMQTPMITAFTGATALHLFLNTSLSGGVVNATGKAHLHLAAYFIIVGVVTGLGLDKKDVKEVKAKEE